MMAIIISFFSIFHRLSDQPSYYLTPAAPVATAAAAPVAAAAATKAAATKAAKAAETMMSKSPHYIYLRFC
jgi:hypothetical protein